MARPQCDTPLVEAGLSMTTLGPQEGFVVVIGWTIPNWSLFSSFQSKKAWKSQLLELVFFFPTLYSQEDFEYFYHPFAFYLFIIKFGFNSIKS